MTKQEFLGALWRALSSLPPDERGSAVQYYEDYFADAGEENEQRVIAELGSPEDVARAILRDYRDLATTPPPQSAGSPPPRAKRGLSPWALLLIVLLAIPLGIPLLIVGFSLLLALFVLVFALGLVAVFVPILCAVIGVAVCWAGVLTLFVSPASALVAIGGGLVSIAVGLLVGMLIFKVLALFVPPLLRGFVRLCRRPFEGGRRV